MNGTGKHEKRYEKLQHSLCETVAKTNATITYLPTRWTSWSVFRVSFFHDEGHYHIEISPLICSGNQSTGFYMTVTFVMKELKRLKIEVASLQRRNQTYFGVVWTVWTLLPPPPLPPPPPPPPTQKKRSKGSSSTSFHCIIYVKTNWNSLGILRNNIFFKKQHISFPNASNVYYFWTLKLHHGGISVVTKPLLY